MRTGITLLGGVGVLGGVLALAVSVALAVLGTGPAQLRGIALAAGVAGSGSIAGWIVARWGRGKNAGLAVAGSLGATLVRLFPVLIALGWIMSREEGAGGVRADVLLVVFYLLLLATDIVLNMIGGSETPPSRSGTLPN
jgi:hypothetical protein